MSKKKHAKHSHSSSGQASRPSPTTSPKPQAAPPNPPARKLNPTVLYGGIAGVIVLVVVAVALLTQGNPATQPPQTAATAAPAAQAAPATATIAATAVAAPATAAAPAESEAGPQPLPAEISVKDAASMRDKGAFMLDVREPNEWEEFHMPDATLIPLGTLSSKLADVPKDKDIVVVCRSGNRSKQGRDILVEAGFTRVTSMAGGMNEWRAADLPTTSGK